MIFYIYIWKFVSNMVQNHTIDMIGRNYQMQCRYWKTSFRKIRDHKTGFGMKQKRCFKNCAMVFCAWIRHRKEWILAEKETENIYPVDEWNVLLKQMRQMKQFPQHGISLHHFWVFNLDVMQGPYSDGKRQIHNEIEKTSKQFFYMNLPSSGPRWPVTRWTGTMSELDRRPCMADSEVSSLVMNALKRDRSCSQYCIPAASVLVIPCLSASWEVGTRWENIKTTKCVFVCK